MVPLKPNRELIAKFAAAGVRVAEERSRAALPLPCPWRARPSS